MVTSKADLGQFVKMRMEDWHRQLSELGLKPGEWTYSIKLGQNVHPQPSPDDGPEQYREYADFCRQTAAALNAQASPEALHWLQQARVFAEEAARLEEQRSKGSRKVRRRMTVDQANERAMTLARNETSFRRLSERNQAKRIGCSWVTWKKTPFFRKLKDRKNLGSQAAKTPCPQRPIAFTDKVEASTAVGEKDEVLLNLIAEQEADQEPSPCEIEPKKIYSRARR
jgi:hypothetical protein